MIEIKRRCVLLSGGCAGLGLLAGCGRRRRSEDHEIQPFLKLYLTFERERDSWSLQARAKNARVNDAPLNGVTVVAFADNGEEVCKKPVGDLDDFDSEERTVHLTCERFPAIITATAEESPCDGARIDLFYYVGSIDARDAGEVNDASLWKQTRRECNEEIPPERALENVTKREEDG